MNDTVSNWISRNNDQVALINGECHFNWNDDQDGSLRDHFKYGNMIKAVIMFLIDCLGVVAIGHLSANSYD